MVIDIPPDRAYINDTGALQAGAFKEAKTMAEKKIFTFEVGSDADQALQQIVSNVASTQAGSFTEADAIRHSIALGRFVTDQIAKKEQIYVKVDGKFVPVDVSPS